MNNLNIFVKAHKSRIKEQLVLFLNQKIKEDKTQISFYKDFVERLIKFSENGKFLRGLLVVLAYEMGSRKANDKIYRTAAAIELIHSGLLIHDDIIDKDSIRRGEKSIPAQYSDGEDSAYGDSMAICAADIAFFLATELLAKSATLSCIDEISKEIQRVAAAEMIDYHFGAKDIEPSTHDILNLYKNKSARYTFSLPLKVGATMADTKPAKIKLLENFGEKIGTVFQVIDDRIGLMGDEKEIGKPIGSDIRQNKKTILRAYLYKKVRDEDKKYLDSVFGNENISKDDIQTVKKILSKNKILMEADSLSNSLSDEAREILSELNLEEKYHQILTELIDYNLKRVI